MPLAKPRSSLSTFLISLLVDPVAGLLWIGRGKLAIIVGIILYAAAIAVFYLGVPPFSIKSMPSLALLEILAKLAFAVGVCCLAATTIPRWYSNGFGLVPIYIISALALALGVRSFLLQPFNIPSENMVPALVRGDYVFVSKLAYGYSRYSIPFGLLPIEGRIFAQLPERGDVVVFRTQDGFDSVKRIVGLPGETIQMIDGILNIDGSPVKLDQMGVYHPDSAMSSRPIKMAKETPPNGKSYAVLSITDDSMGDNTAPHIVPAGQYFLMGDNRDNSYDSRFTMGTVPFENLIGKVVKIFWNSEGIAYSERQSLL
ncbi:signal peptidase I [Phyllobacterium sp. 628]|uniref:signal peptidase I n=1 Tax=Phyllobacterium sp. 628 TaxID=2718938 RepID=UPI001662773A|nr:signal peptidase I [Phyllobacterium sp. 628]QND51036.1 signal peptidase I [Phyllobacterium sp. 628]